MPVALRLDCRMPALTYAAPAQTIASCSPNRCFRRGIPHVADHSGRAPRPFLPSSSRDQPAAGPGRRAARHHARRRRLRLRRRRQALPRRHGGAVVRVARLFRAPARGGRLQADVRAAVLSQLRRQGARDQHRARGATDRHGARGHGQGAVREFGVRGERHGDQARLVRQQCARPPAEEEDHLAAARLPRRHHRQREPHRARLRPHRFRPADRAHPAHRLPVLLSRRAAGRERGGVRRAARRESRAADPARGSRHRRRVLRRAGDGRRRRDRAAGDLLRPRAADPEEVRHPVRRRRGDLRLRPHRQHVRVADLQSAARHHDPGEGAVGGLRADLGQPRLRQALRRSCSRRATSSASSATATPTRRIRCRRPSRWKR